MQSYPSPTAITADSAGPFYSSSSSHQQHQQSGLANPDDLQLAAQLSRGLAPIMNAGPGGGIPDGQDPRGQGTVNLAYHHDAQAHAAHMQANHAQMDPMGGQYGLPDGPNAPRKRSKVSRACDECRRKKIRCDATGEPGDEQCSSCKRVGTRCQFSRVPMKRGPSKGYIKELADRLNTLEGAMQAGEIPVPQYLPHHDGSLQSRGSDEFSPPPNTENTQRKRTYSSTSGDFHTPYQPQRPPTGWASQELHRHLPHPSPSFATPQPAPSTAQIFREPNYSPNGLQPFSQWRNAPEPVHRLSSSFESMVQMDHIHSDHVAEWDDSIVDAYYNFIHPTYPLLAQSRSRLSSRLAKCPSTLREAFYESLHAAVRSFSVPNMPPVEQQSTKRATQLIAASQFESTAARTLSTNLVYLQTMLLMSIEADNRGPPTTRGQSSPSRAVWLGSAVGLAYSIKLHVHKLGDKQSENDSDSDVKLGRRIWWSLVIMDRWHASSTSSPLLVPDGTVIVYPEDQALLGDSLYHLARLSIVLGHFSAVTIIPTDLPTLSVPPPSILGTLLRGELERCRESFPASFFPPSNSPLIHLCYWYLRILMELSIPESEPLEILVPAMHIVTQLTHNAGLVSPLNHHATALAASALLELKGYESTREEAESGLKTLLESRIAPSGWDAAIRDMILKRQHVGAPGGASASVSSKGVTSQQALTASQGLQRLADLATATEGGRSDTSTSEGRKEGEKSNASGHQPFQRFHDLRELVRSGYLSILGGEPAR